MCLDLSHTKRDDRPYNRRKWRWKVVLFDYGRKGDCPYHHTNATPKAPVQSCRYAVEKWLKARGSRAPSAKGYFGFHCFITNSNHGSFTAPEQVWLKVRVRKHLASGHYIGRQSETWEEMFIPRSEMVRAGKILQRRQFLLGPGWRKYGFSVKR